MLRVLEPTWELQPGTALEAKMAALVVDHVDGALGMVMASGV